MMNDLALLGSRSHTLGALLLVFGCANIAGIEEAQLQTNSTGGTTGTSTSPQGSELCTTYCDTVMENCQGKFAVYASPQTCTGICDALVRAGKTGTAGDLSGNTVQCRLNQAINAKVTGEPASYCFAAGPGGGNLCGTDCEGYCVVMQQICANEFSRPQFNNSISYCLTVACPSVPTGDAGYSTEVYGEGNNLNCRLYHMSSASVSEEAAGTHCSHAVGEHPCD